MAVGKTAVLGAVRRGRRHRLRRGFLERIDRRRRDCRRRDDRRRRGAGAGGGGAAPQQREPAPGVAARRQRARVPGAELPRPRAELPPPRAGSPWFRPCTGYKIAARLRRSMSLPPWRPGIFRCKCGVRREAPRPPEPPRPGSPWRPPCTCYKIAARFHRSTCPPPLRPGIFRCIGGVRLGPLSLDSTKLNTAEAMENPSNKERRTNIGILLGSLHCEAPGADCGNVAFRASREIRRKSNINNRQAHRRNVPACSATGCKPCPLTGRHVTKRRRLSPRI